jgi:surface antigen/uncharacterized protein YukE
MAAILIRPNQLRSTAQSLIQKAKSVQTAINAVEKSINDLNSIVFAGNRASGLKTHYARVKNELLSASSLIQKFSNELQETASVFDKADGNQLSPLPAPTPAPIIVKAGSPEIQNQPAVIAPYSDYSSIAKAVKPGTPGEVELGYPRNGYNGVQSDCTWYAAQAVLIASGGKVHLANLGAATHWVENAQKNGYVVDNTPAAGSVIQFNFGHVGFIENVENKNGKILVTWSEEEASGGRPGKDWSNVTQIDSQLRWRVTADLTDYFSKGAAQCIHVNY